MHGWQDDVQLYTTMAAKFQDDNARAIKLSKVGRSRPDFLFFGEDAVRYFMKQFDFSEDDAIKFGRCLRRDGVFLERSSGKTDQTHDEIQATTKTGAVVKNNKPEESFAEHLAGPPKNATAGMDLVQTLYSSEQSLTSPSGEEEGDEVVLVDSQLCSRDLLKGLTDLREKLNLAVSRREVDNGSVCVSASILNYSKTPSEDRASERLLSFHAVSSRTTMQTESENESHPTADAAETKAVNPTESPVSATGLDMIIGSWNTDWRKPSKGLENIAPERRRVTTFETQNNTTVSKEALVPSTSRDSKPSQLGAEAIVGSSAPKVHTTLSPMKLRQIVELRNKKSSHSKHSKPEYNLAAKDAVWIPARRRSPSAPGEELGDDVRDMRLSHLVEPDVEPRALIWRRIKHSKAQGSPEAAENHISPPFREPRRRTFFGLPTTAQNLVREGEMPPNVKKSKKLGQESNSSDKKSDDSNSPVERGKKAELATSKVSVGSSIKKEPSPTETGKGGTRWLQHDLLPGQDEAFTHVLQQKHREMSSILEPNNGKIFTTEMGAPRMYSDKSFLKESKHVRLQTEVHGTSHTEAGRRPLPVHDNYQGMHNRGINIGQPLLDVVSEDRDPELTKPSSPASNSQQLMDTVMGTCNRHPRSRRTTNSGLSFEAEIAPIETNRMRHRASHASAEETNGFKVARSKTSGNSKKISERVWSLERHRAPQTTSRLNPEAQSDLPAQVRRRRTFFAPSIPLYSSKAEHQPGDDVLVEKSVQRSPIKGFMTFSRSKKNIKDIKGSPSRGSNDFSIAIPKANNSDTSNRHESAITSQEVPGKPETKSVGISEVGLPTEAEMGPSDAGSVHRYEQKSIRKSIRHRLGRRRVLENSSAVKEQKASKHAGQSRVNDAHAPIRRLSGLYFGDERDRRGLSAFSEPPNSADLAPLLRQSHSNAPRSPSVLSSNLPLKLSDDRSPILTSQPDSPSGLATTVNELLIISNVTSKRTQLNVEPPRAPKDSS